MSESAVTAAENQVTFVEDVFAAAPVDADRVGHHTVLSVGQARVIVLAFARGQHMREHRSHRPLLLQALDGRIRVNAAGRSHELAPGGLLYLPNAEPHSVEALEASRVSLIPIGV